MFGKVGSRILKSKILDWFPNCSGFLHTLKPCKIRRAKCLLECLFLNPFFCSRQLIKIQKKKIQKTVHLNKCLALLILSGLQSFCESANTFWTWLRRWNLVYSVLKSCFWSSPKSFVIPKIKLSFQNIDWEFRSYDHQSISQKNPNVMSRRCIC